MMFPQVSIEDLCCILHNCRQKQDLAVVANLCSYVYRHGLEDHRVLGNQLAMKLLEVSLIGDSGNTFLEWAFNHTLSWNILISGFLDAAKPQLAFWVFQHMPIDVTFEVKGRIFVNILKSCIKLEDLKTGSHMLAESCRTGLLYNDNFVGSSFIDMYAKFGMVSAAREVFCMLPVRDVVSWTALIGGYVDQGENIEAFKLLEMMERKGVCPNPVTYVCIIKACDSSKTIDWGHKLHVEVLKKGLVEGNVHVGCALVYMYAKCGSFDIAQQLCSGLRIQNVASWNALIAVYTEYGYGESALYCFQRMQSEGICPDSVTSICALKACSSIRDVEKGQNIDADIQQKGFLLDNYVVGNSLVDMYAKCGSLTSAQKVFDKLTSKDVVSWTVLIGGYAEQGQGNDAIKCFELMQKNGISPNAATFVCVLKACVSISSIEKAREMHIELEKEGLLMDLDAGNALLDMFAKYGHFVKAIEMFDNLMVRNAVSWNILIASFVEHGYEREASICLDQMRCEGLSPTVVTFVCALKACANLAALSRGQQLHSEIEMTGVFQDIVIANAIIDMYAKCGLLSVAKELFDRIEIRDIVTWTTLIEGYIENGHAEDGLKTLYEMQIEGFSPDAVTLLCGLKACGEIGDIDQGNKIHAEVQKQGLVEEDMMIGSALVYMYTKCRSIVEAKNAFAKIPVRNVIAWNAFIVGNVENGHDKEALWCFEMMKLEGVLADAVTYASILRACGNVVITEKCREILVEIEKKGLSENLIVSYAFVDFYVKCGLLDIARQRFDKLPVRNVVLWTALIVGYIEYGQENRALECFEEMELEGVSPDPLTLLCILKSFCNIGAVQKASKMHIELELNDIVYKDTAVGNALVDIYGKFGWLTRSQQVFDRLIIRNVVSWNALMVRYIEHGYGEKALSCFEQMQVEGICPDVVSFLCSLKACTSTGAIWKGVEIHSEIERRGLLETDLFVGTALIDMYGKCGSIVDAEKVFDKLAFRDVSSWNTLIFAHAVEGAGNKAIECVLQMQIEGVSMTNTTFICILKACGIIGAATKAGEIHAEIERQGMLESDHLIGNTLVDTYAKCGFITKARDIFEKLPIRGVVSWTALMKGYAQIGKNEDALCIFDEMLGEGIKPDPISFIVLLNACSHAGLIDKSQTYFEAMSKDFSIVPGLEHQLCMLNLFNRVGHFDKAIVLVNNLSAKPDLVVWQIMLSACRQWGNFQLAKEAFQCALKLDKRNAAAYVHMSHICRGG